MLIALMPEQVANHWNELKDKLVEFGPPTSEGVVDYNMVLEACLAGAMQIWASTAGEHVTGYCVTQIINDPFSRSKSLLIYAVFTIDGKKSILKEWEDAYATMVAHAKAKGCRRICAYSSNPKIISLAQHFGLNVDNRYIIWEV